MIEMHRSVLESLHIMFQKQGSDEGSDTIVTPTIFTVVCLHIFSPIGRI